MFEWLKTIDIFGEKPTLFINKNTQNKSYLGGIFVILMIDIFIVCGVYFGQELWLKSNPTVNTVKQTVDYPLPLNIDKDKLDFFVQVGTGGIFNNSIYTITGFLRNSTALIPIDLERCTNDSFSKENLEFFYPFNFSTSWCIKKNQSILNSTTFRIQGLFGQNNYHYIQFQIRRCLNTTNNNNSCAPQSVIDTSFNSNYLSVYMIDNFIQTNNHTNPTIKTVKDVFFLISKNYFTSGNTYIHPIIVRSDDQLIFKTGYNEINSFSIEPVITSINPNFVDDKFCTFNIQLNNFNEIYYRSYMKIQNLLAELGGIMNLIQIIFMVLCSNYSRTSYFEELINSYFSFNIDSNSSNPLRNSLKKFSVNLENPTEREQPQTIKLKSNTSTNRICILDKYDFDIKFEDYHKKVQFSFCNKFFCARFLNCHLDPINKKKHAFFEFGVKILIERLSIINILKTMIDIDKIKFLVFDQNQLVLFDHIKRPFIDFEINEFKNPLDLYIFRDRNEIISKNELVSKLILLKNENNVISQKIFETFK